jgi:hypothetical protein
MAWKAARRYWPGWGLGEARARMAGWQSMKMSASVSQVGRRAAAEIVEINKIELLLKRFELQGPRDAWRERL